MLLYTYTKEKWLALDIPKILTYWGLFESSIGGEKIGHRAKDLERYSFQEGNPLH